MQYNRHNFKSKQKLTAQQMNEIEQGILDLVDHANSSDGKLNLTIGTVTSGSTAAATFSNGKLNLVLPKGEKGEAGTNGAAGAKGDTGPAGPAGEGLTEKAKTLLLTLLENATYDLYDVSSTLNALRAEWNVSSGGIGPAANGKAANGKATGDKAAE